MAWDGWACQLLTQKINEQANVEKGHVEGCQYKICHKSWHDFYVYRSMYKERMGFKF